MSWVTAVGGPVFLWPWLMSDLFLLLVVLIYFYCSIVDL